MSLKKINKILSPQHFNVFLLSGLMSILLSSCSTTPKSPTMDRVPVSFDSLPGWEEDKHLESIPALKRTCEVIAKKSNSDSMITKTNGRGSASDWKPFCKKLHHQLQKGNLDSNVQVRTFLEDNLTPHQISVSGSDTGTFTGYYVPILRGSLRRHGPYQIPLYRLPKQAKFRKLSRSKIVNGALKNKGLELVWVDDAVEAFFIQIQGSGRIELDNGHKMNVGFAGQNGHPYFAIGKALIDKGVLTPETTNMQSIKNWLWNNPRQAEKIMSLNQSYVFFKERSSGDVIGAHGVPLTPQRSMAVDRNYISLGTPLWLDAKHPHPEKGRLQRLLVAQDVGGAIKGAIRGDYYWGVGDRAGSHAGRMNSEGSLYLLLPN